MFVVICLKNRTFAVSQTSNPHQKHHYVMLWFAWKIVLLQYHKHRYLFYHIRDFRCDLLEKSYFCSITNIQAGQWIKLGTVVICLKNRTFAVSQTSRSPKKTTPKRCDLLEKSYFCSITNICSLQYIRNGWVVICLKNRTFAVSQTSAYAQKELDLALWFAWKIVLLQYHKHRRRGRFLGGFGCDLLEKSYFCSITNIMVATDEPTDVVVICLKNRTFAVSQTSNNNGV